MKDLLIQHRTQLLASLAALAFMLFVWPTPYVITRDEGTVYRVNRFTGVRQQATDTGWKTEEEISRESRAELSREEAKQAAKRRAKTRQVLQDLAAVNDRDHRPFPGEIVIHNPTQWELVGEYADVLVEYYEVTKDGGERFLAQEEVPASTIAPESRTKLSVFNTAINEWAPPEVTALPNGTSYRQKITMTFRQVRDAQALSDGEESSLISLDPPFVFRTTWEFRRSKTG